ncbi:tubulin epsilon and delta complex protein 2 isoform X1 [Cervus canadensis]|uniref:tubulin epsilon and delta complex protein 2 isoform X1 n=1 Tax=Cervus canadensis TaxID=1574408 RepID=UPI001CA3861F|nr:tubulin epsilon and delta complex protein 2 isoform X1 [Cervus canadensis]
MLPAECSRRLVAELRDALDSCAERQRQLEQSLRVSRRLLRAWEPAETPAPEPTPGPEINEEAPSSACPPSPQDLKELELLTQALEKAVRVRKSLSKTGKGVKANSLKSGSTSPATRASAPPSTSHCAGSCAPETKPPRGVRHPWVPAKDLSGRRLLLVGDGAYMGKEAGANKPEAGLRDQQIIPQAAPQVPEAFTLKDKGALLRLPEAFRKAASRNARLPMCASRLWAQLSSMQTGDSVDVAAATAKTQFLQKMQTAAGQPGSRLSSAEVGRLQKACSLLRLRMREELTADPKDWMQEYRSLLTLEGLQALAEQCLHGLQELRSAVVEQPRGPWPEGPPRAASPCGGGTDPMWSPQLLLYSSTEELQTLAALRLRVAMLDQQVHLEKVLMAELLPLLSEQEPLGRPWLALCRAAHCLLCEGGQRFLTVLRDEPADRLSPP